MFIKQQNFIDIRLLIFFIYSIFHFNVINFIKLIQYKNFKFYTSTRKELLKTIFRYAYDFLPDPLGGSYIYTTLNKDIGHLRTNSNKMSG